MLKRHAQAMERALRIANLSLGDPAACAANMKQIADLLNVVEPYWTPGSRTPQRVVPLIFATPIVVTGATTGNSTELAQAQFPTVGHVVGVRAGVLNADSSFGLDMNFLGVTIQVNGDRDLITNGKSAAPTPLSTLCGNQQNANPMYFELDNDVTPSDRWFCQVSPFLGTGATSCAPNGTYFPFLAFLFEEDKS